MWRDFIIYSIIDNYTSNTKESFKLRFDCEFSKVMIKMSEIKVKIYRDEKIRKVCLNFN